MDTLLCSVWQGVIMANLELANGFWACFTKHLSFWAFVKKAKNPQFFVFTTHFQLSFLRILEIYTTMLKFRKQKTIKWTKSYKKRRKKTISPKTRKHDEISTWLRARFWQVPTLLAVPLCEIQAQLAFKQGAKML